MAQLSVFGGVDLREEDRRLDAVLAQPKRMALLVYLAVARPHGFHSRDTLLALFWPESDDRRARRALRKSLHFLRTHLGKEVVVSRGDDVGLAAGVRCDAAAFDAAVTAGRPRDALELYRGEFLRGFHVSGAAGFERWADAEAQRFRRAAARLAWSLAEGEEATGSEIEAVRLARRAHAIQPLDENGIRRLMELLARLGDRAGALRVFEEARRRVRSELDIDLSAQTLVLQSRIAGSSADPARAAATGAGSSVDDRSTGPAAEEPAPESSGPIANLPSTTSPPTVSVSDREQARERAFRVRPAGVAAVSVGVALGLVALIGRGHFVESSDPTVSSGAAIGVLPFTVTSEEEVWREDMATLLATSLHGAAGLEAREPEYVLKFWQSEFDGAAPTREQVRTAARRIGADWVVTGSMATANGRLRLTAEAWNPAENRRAGPVTVEGKRDSLFSAVDHLAVKLLRDGVIADDASALPIELSRVTTSSPRALEAYLEGERAWRSARLRTAAEAFSRAVRHDSSFALARYRLAIAQYWVGTGHPLRHLRSAVRNADRLHDREATLARGWLALQEGDVQAGLDSLRDLTHRSPEFGEAWLRLGDALLHNGGRLLVPMSEFRSAMHQARRANPLAAEPYWHLLEDAFFREDSAEARRLSEAYRRVDPYSPACIGYLTAYQLAWGDPESHAAAVDRLPSLGGEVRGPLNCALSVLDRAPPLEPAMDLVADELESPRRPEVERRMARPNRIRLSIRGGAIDEARRLLRLYYGEDEGARRLAAANVLLLDVLGYPDPTSAREAELILAEAPSPDERFWMAAAALAEGRMGDVDRGISALHGSAGSLQEGAAAQARLLARALEMLRALETGDPVNLRELFELQATLPGPNSGMHGSRLIPFAREWIRLRLAEVMLEEGRPEEALRYVESLPMDSHATNAPSILLEGLAREALADTVAAQAAYTRFLRWWESADPELDPMKEEARQGLRRLGLFDR